ncbi:MAG: tetratricopeptide repeat protein [Elainellaceae cyanobacterium]
MATLSEALAIAHQHYQSGQLPEATQICLNLLQQAPGDAGVWLKVGMTLHRFGKLQEAINCYQRAIDLQPDQPSAHNNLGIAFKQIGRYDEAFQRYQTAIALQPDYPEAHNNLGNLLRQQGKFDEAIRSFQHCLSIAPDFSDARYNLGNAFREAERFEEAIACYRHLLENNPQNTDAHNNLGNALQGMGQYEEAILAYQAALQIDGSNPSTYNNLGAALDELNRVDESIAAYQTALSLRPDYADAYYNVGNVWRKQDQLDTSVVCYQKAIALKPDQPLAHNNMGLALHDLGQLPDAIAAYQRAIAQAPTYADAHLNLGLSLLTVGDLKAGFAEYEWRWQVKGPNFKPPRIFAQPVWDGSDLNGQTILLHAEQGFGDTLQFIRYASLVAQWGGRVMVECQEPLIRLLKTCPGIHRLIPSGTPLPNFQVHAPLMSLPYLMGTTVATIPETSPYLDPPRSRIQLNPSPDALLTVGVAWSGSPTHRNDCHRSCPFDAFQSLFDVSGVQFYSLQKGDRATDLSTLDAHSPRVIDLSPQLDDFADTAAAIAHLDLVITVDTSVAHLAGALGCPVWILLSNAPDWRWMLNRDDSPWYPTARLFRQPSANDWNTVLNAVKAALSDQLRNLATPSPAVHPSITSPPLPSSPLLQTLALAEHQLNAGHLDAAERSCQDMLRQFPPHSDVLKLLGLIAYRRKQFVEAIAWYQQALELDPTDITLQVNLGNAYLRQGKPAKAVPCYRQAAHVSGNPMVYNNLGVALKSENRYAEAIAYYQQALIHNPNYADTHYNLANALRDQAQFEDAVHHYQHAISIRSDYVDAWNNLANVFKDVNQIDEAIACYRHALSLNPNHASAHHNLGYALLVSGDLAAGFAEYEWRWQVKGFKPPRSCPQPVWDGSDLTGKTILLHTEQGFGDTIQFIRYAALVADRGGTVIVECRTPLARLLKTASGVHQVVSRTSSPPDFDVHAPLMSVPHILGTTLDTVPNEVPYLHLSNRQSGSLRVPPDSGLKVGMVWAGSPTHKNDRNRSCPFAYVWSLLRTPGVHFYSLQTGDRAGDIARFCDHHWPLEDLSDRLDDFADTARAIAQLDLVITVDTAVAHLAGALGKPVWILLPYAPDWRWMLDRDDSPWYPTARLFRQPEPGDWASVFAHLKPALHQWVRDTPAPSASTAPLAAMPDSATASLFPSPPASSGCQLGIGIELSTSTGWGIFGTNLVLHLLNHSEIQPLLLLPPLASSVFNPVHHALLKPLFDQPLQFEQALNPQLNQTQADSQCSVPFALLKALGNHFVTASALKPIQGTSSIGIIFFEDTHLTTSDLETAKSYDRILAGSSWNAQILHDYGLTNIQTVFQGIDPTIFHPAPKSGLLGDRFVIFSGGKLEYRKGQDIVIAAFREFCARHPDALLLTAWHNIWQTTIHNLDRANHVSGQPKSDRHGRLLIQDWLVANGIPKSACIELGPIPNHQVGQILREADVAVFPNRCEGGTNLVAMESLACGIPTILSANTGHLDLIHHENCYPLYQQNAVQPIPPYHGTDGWGESTVDEVVETLEAVYQNRDQARQRGIAAAQFMQDWTWDKQVKRLLNAIQDLV